jgi:site-specific recombinase XerD
VTASNALPPLIERFFTQRLMRERRASPHTIASYRDTFRQLFKFLQQKLRKPPSALVIEDLDAPRVSAFLDHLERDRQLSVRSRNLRLTAIHSFFRYAAFEMPTHSAHIQRVLSIPSKRFSRSLVRYLDRSEVDALLATPDQRTWHGRRDHAFILMAVQTGLRLSEITGATRDDLVLGTGAHVRVVGKGRKERSTPIAKATATVLKAWLKEPTRGEARLLFPNAKGNKLTVHGVQYMLNKHAANAAKTCASLKGKRIGVHLLRHTMALEMLQAGVDRAVIALWLGHESVETTQIYLEATLAMKEHALSRMASPDTHQRAFKPDDQLMSFLNSL